VGEPDDERDEDWVKLMLEQIGMERALKALGRILTKEAQEVAREEDEDGEKCGDLVSRLLFGCASHLEDAAMDYYVSTK
jgi:hypothetical protein